MRGDKSGKGWRWGRGGGGGWKRGVRRGGLGGNMGDTLGMPREIPWGVPLESTPARYSAGTPMEVTLRDTLGIPWGWWYHGGYPGRYPEEYPGRYREMIP